MVSEKNFEEELKKVIFDRIYEIQDKNQKIIDNLNHLGKNEGIEFQISNIARTATNKLITDIVPQFKQAGLNFYSTSIVSKAVYMQIIEYIEKGNTALKKCNDNFKPKDSSGEREQGNEQVVALKPTNAFARFFARLRMNFQRPVNKKAPSNKEERLENIKSHIEKYESLDQELWDYNLRDNIVPALAEVICPANNFIYLATTVPALVYEDIAPELIRLGLGDLVPQLEEQLTAKYTKCEEGRLENCTTQSEVDLYIPNFEKYKANRKVAESPENPMQDNKENIASDLSVNQVEEGIEPGED